MTAPMLERAHMLEGAPHLLLREQSVADGHPVLYIHGATFPSACSIMHRFDGVSWADHLNGCCFSAYGLDFAGFGGSDRYEAVPERTIPGRSETAVEQISRAVDFVRAHHGGQRVSLIAHSWGTIAACLFASLHPEAVQALSLFGPIIRREGPPRALPDGSTRLVTIRQQYDRFVEDVPKDHPPVLLDRHFKLWAEAYLATDPDSRMREPPAVLIPNGPAADIAAAWSGEMLYDPARLMMPLQVVRGAWDSLCTDEDVAWLRRDTPACARFEDVKIKRGTHLMHLEEQRGALHDAAARFLRECLEFIRD